MVNSLIKVCVAVLQGLVLLLLIATVIVLGVGFVYVVSLFAFWLFGIATNPSLVM